MDRATPGPGVSGLGDVRRVGVGRHTGRTRAGSGTANVDTRDLHPGVLPVGLSDSGLFAPKMPWLEDVVEGSPLGEIMGELTPRDGEPVLTERYGRSVLGTRLDTTLRLAGVDTAILSGAPAPRADPIDLDARYADVVTSAQAFVRLDERT